MSDESKSSPSAALAFVRMAVAGFTFAMVPVLVFEAMRLLGWAEEGGRWELACSLLAFLASGLVLLVLSRALPAGRPLLPVRPFAVLPRYVLFAMPWVGFVVGYLHLMPALGHPLPPQELLLYLAQNGLAAHDSVVVVVVIVIGAPLAEELMFRGW